MIKMVIIMDKVGKVSLNNKGAFVAHMKFKYIDDSGLTKTSSTSSKDILVTQTETVDPGDLGVPNGSIFHLIAVVVAGKDNEADNNFIYNNGSPTAQYSITGTTLNNTLHYL
jgi:hypothetical protein